MRLLLMYNDIFFWSVLMYSPKGCDALVVTTPRLPITVWSEKSSLAIPFTQPFQVLFFALV